MFSLSHPVKRARAVGSCARGPHRPRARLHVGRAAGLRGAGRHHRKSVPGNDARAALHRVRRQRLLLARPGRQLRGRRTPLEHGGTRDGGARQRALRRDRRPGMVLDGTGPGREHAVAVHVRRTERPHLQVLPARGQPVGDGLREPHLQRPARAAGCRGLEERHGRHGWELSPTLHTGAAIVSSVSGGSAQLALGFASTKGIVRIDDVYLDPRMRR